MIDVEVRWLAHAATDAIQANEAGDVKDVDESPTVCEVQRVASGRCVGRAGRKSLDTPWEVSDIQSTSGVNGPSELTVHQYTVYFSANDGTTGEELWAHNSLNGTTWQVIDLHPTGGAIGDIHVHESNLYFSGEDNSVGRELWRLTFSKDVSFV